MTFTNLKVKAPYVCGRTGALLHRTNPASWLNWAQFHMSDRVDRVEYQVKTACRFPSVIHDAVLLASINDRTPPGRKYYESLKPLQLCKYCFPEA